MRNQLLNVIDYVLAQTVRAVEIKQWRKRKFSFQHFVESVPPLYAWPAPLKQVIRLLAIGLCLMVYLLLIGGVVTIIAAIFVNS